MTDVAAAADFGARLAALIYQRKREREDGYSAKQLAADTGVSRTTIQAALGGQRVSRRTAEKLAGAFGLTLEELLAVPTPAGDEVMPGQWEPGPADEDVRGESPAKIALEEYVSSLDGVVRTLKTTPDDPLSLPLKVAILDAWKAMREQQHRDVPREFYDVRRRVLAGEFE